MSDKNIISSYGLTLVTGMPFQSHLASQIMSIQNEIDTILPALFHWYATAQLHVTLAALLRGRYRDGPPLRRSELPEDLDSLALAIAQAAEDVRPFDLELRGLFLGENGELAVHAHGGEMARQRFGSIHAQFPELDPPKSAAGMHATLGFLSEPGPADVDKGRAVLRGWDERFLGVTHVESAWLVHYGNRTLNELLGKIKLPLGSKFTLEGKLLADALALS